MTQQDELDFGNELQCEQPVALEDLLCDPQSVKDLRALLKRAQSSVVYDGFDDFSINFADSPNAEAKTELLSAQEKLKDGSTTKPEDEVPVTEARTARGEIRKFERDEAGQITRITHSNGMEWVRSTDGTRFELKGTNEKIPARGVSVEKDGTYSFELTNGEKIRNNADGSISRVDIAGRERIRGLTDGSQIVFDAQGRIAASTDAQGKQRAYGYDEAGTLTSLKEPDGSLWKSTDGKNWCKEGTRQFRSGEVVINADGSQTIKNNRNEQTTFKLDGSTVSSDKGGRVTAVKDAAGKEQRFEYDKDGKLAKYKDESGTWATRDGKLWTKEGSRETRTATITVERDGTVHEIRSGGTELNRRTNGWTEIKEKGQTRLEHGEKNGAVVVRNPEGQTTEVRYPNGKSRKFEYNDEGKVTKVSDEKGTWTSRDGQNWQKVGSTETWKGRIEVGEAGIYKEVSEKGNQRIFKNDGSRIETNADGKVTSITAANGKAREFEYGADGKLAKMKDTNGGVWTTTDQKEWKKEGTDKTWKGTIGVRPDGTYEEKSATTGNRVIATTDGREVVLDAKGKMLRGENPDGKSISYIYDGAGKPKGFEVADRDGSVVTLDDKNRVVKVKDAAGVVREFGYAENGKLNEIKSSGKTWTSADGLEWKSNKGDTFKGQVFVTPDGTYNYILGKTLVTHQLDGNTKFREPSGATRTENPKGQIVETSDAKGVKRSYGYDAAGKIIRQTEGDAVWETTDQWKWTRKGDNAVWHGTVAVEKDGTYYHQDSNGNRQWRKPDGSREEVNYAEMDASAKSINDATYWGITTGGTDEEKFQGALEGKSVRQRQMMEEIYQRKYGKSIAQEARDEMSGHDLEKTLALLQKGDGADNAGALRVALTERGQWVYGRSSSECERVIRDTLETMSVAEIQETDRQYRERYGQSLSDAILNDSNLSEKTKQAARVYLKGYDVRTPQETIDLAKVACTNGDATMFQEAMRRAPKQARDYFAGAEGQELIKQSFEGSWLNVFTLGLTGNVTDTELRHVQDYAEFGKLSVASQVRDNTSWLGDNEQAIESSLRKMSAEERESYRVGKLLSEGKSAGKEMTEDQRARAQKYYEKTHAALEGAAGVWFSGDSQRNELAKWEDMILHQGGSLVSKLAEHRGMIYDSHMHDVISTVEDMTEQDWKRLKEDPTFKDRIEHVLDTYLNASEKQRVLDVLNAKSGAASFEESKQNRRPVLDIIEDNMRWYDNKEDNIYRAIENMTAAEQAMYRRGKDPANNDAQAKKFASDLEAKLVNALDSSEQKPAFGLLEKIARGEKPEMDIMDKLNLHASYWDADEAQAIRDLQEAFEKDPKLRDRINSPKTESERSYAEQFKDAARRAMGSSDYEKYARPLIETGRLSVELQLDLSRGYFDDDEQGACKDIQKASTEEKQRILTDKDFQDRVLGFLSDDERQIALNSMRQGEMRAEDKLRSFMVGAGTSEDEIKQVFAEIKNRDAYRQQGVPEHEIDARIKSRLDEVKREYASKYGSDLSADLMDELGGQDLQQVRRNLDQRDARSEFLFARDQASQTRSGFGSGLVDAVWDGTGYQVDDDVNQMARLMVEDPAKVQDFVENLYKSIDAHAASKEALADALVDAAIAAVGVGGAFFTGGVSLSLLAYTGVAAAVLKVGAKAAIMGSDYDFASSQVLLDAGTGFADGFTTFLGAGAAKSAAQKTLTAGGKALLKEGGEATLKEGTEALLKQGLKQGGKLTDDAIKALARKVAKEGEEEALAQILKKSLGEAIEEQSRHWLKQIVKSTPDNILAGMAGGGASGTIRAGFEARSAEDFVQRAGTSAGFGALGGGAAPFVIAPVAMVGGKAWNAAKRMFPGAEEALDGAGARTAAKLHPHDSAGGPRPNGDSKTVAPPNPDRATAQGAADRRVAPANDDAAKKTSRPKAERHDATPDKATDSPTDKSANKATDGPTDKSANKATDSPTDKSTNKSTDRPIDKSTDKPTDKPMVKKGDQVRHDSSKVRVHESPGDKLPLMDDPFANRVADDIAKHDTAVLGLLTEGGDLAKQHVHLADSVAKLANGTPPVTDVVLDIPANMQSHVSDYVKGKITAEQFEKSTGMTGDHSIRKVVDAARRTNASAKPGSPMLEIHAVGKDALRYTGTPTPSDDLGQRAAARFMVIDQGNNSAKTIFVGDRDAHLASAHEVARLSSPAGGPVYNAHDVYGTYLKTQSMPRSEEMAYREALTVAKGKRPEIRREPVEVIPPHGSRPDALDRTNLATVGVAPDETVADILDMVGRTDPKFARQLQGERITTGSNKLGRGEKDLNVVSTAKGGYSDVETTLDHLRLDPSKTGALDYRQAVHELVGHRGFDNFMSQDPARKQILDAITNDYRARNLSFDKLKTAAGQAEYMRTPQELAAERIANEAVVRKLQQRAAALAEGGATMPRELAEELQRLTRYRQELDKAVQTIRPADPGLAKHFDDYFASMREYMKQTFDR